MSITRTSALALLLLLTACSGVGRYFGDRGRDLLDVVDVKYGIGVGAVAKVEVSDYLGAGLGLGGANHHEWFGRRREWSGPIYIQAGAFGGEGFDDFTYNVMLWTVYDPPYKRPPPLQRYRVGGEVLAGFVHFGGYVNFGELADFFAGLVGADPAEDDGVAFGAPFWEYRDRYYSPPAAEPRRAGT